MLRELKWHVAGCEVLPDEFVLSSLPGRTDAWMGERWARAVIEAGNTTYDRYLDVRLAFEREIADASSDRAAWGRARAALLGLTPQRRGARGRRIALASVPAEYREAFERLEELAGISPATARHYRSSLRVLFELADGEALDPVALENLLEEVAAGGSYRSAVRSSWAALERAVAALRRR